MGKKVTVTESFDVNYTCRDRDTNDDIKCIRMNWENRSQDEIQQLLNMWLTACGCNLVVVEKTWCDC